MTFLVDADLPRSAANVVRRHGYDAVDVRDIGLRHADDSEIASHAQRQHQCLGDFSKRISLITMRKPGGSGYPT